MAENEIYIRAIVGLLTLLCVIGGIFVKSFIKMADDISEIKTDVRVASTNHDHLEKRVEKLENTKLKFYPPN